MDFPPSLRVAVLPKNGLFEVERKTQDQLRITGGLEAEYVDILLKSLKFQMEVLVPADDEWGRETQNGSWTGLVGMVLRNECDLALGGLAVTEKRSRVIHYSAPYRYTYLTFATNLPPQLPRFTTFLYPFTMNLWICLAVLVFLMPFAFRTLMCERRSMGNYVLGTIKCLLNGPFMLRHNGDTRDYFLVGGYFVGSMLISLSYAATLLSFLTVPLREPGVQNIKHLSELVGNGQFRAGAFKGTNVLNILRSDQHASIRGLADHIESNHYEIQPTKKSVQEFYESKKSALIAPEIYFRMNFPHSLRISPEPVKCTAISMVVSKTFCCKKKLDSYINRIFTSGLSQNTVRRILTKIEIKNFLKKAPTDQDMALSLEDVMGAFIFYFIGITLSAIILLLEVAVPCLNKRKKSF